MSAEAKLAKNRSDNWGLIGESAASVITKVGANRGRNEVQAVRCYVEQRDGGECRLRQAAADWLAEKAMVVLSS